MDIVYILDIVGTFSFAISGALIGLNKKFDIFGIFILAFVTAVGGGMSRDVLINSHPINWIGDLNYIYTIILAVGFTVAFRTKILPLRKTLLLFDTIGIAIFTLIGVEKCLNLNMHPLICMIMGVITPVFGGLIRDILTNEVPMILEKEIYAAACLVGALVYFLLNHFGFNSDVNSIVCVITVFVIRMLAVKNSWELPKMQKDIFEIKK